MLNLFPMDVKMAVIHLLLFKIETYFDFPPILIPELSPVNKLFHWPRFPQMLILFEKSALTSGSVCFL